MTGTLEVGYEVARWNSFIVWLVFEVMDAEIGERVVYFLGNCQTHAREKVRYIK
jgi:hypothetical protein